MARDTWDDSEDFDGEDGPKALRDALKKATGRIKELEKANSDLAVKVRSTSVADVLKTKELSPKLAKHILRDIEGDPTPEAIEDWLTENADVFGFTVAAPKGGGVVAPEDRDALRKIADIDNSATRPVGEEAQLAALNSVTNWDDLKALLGGSGQG